MGGTLALNALKNRQQSPSVFKPLAWGDMAQAAEVIGQALASHRLDSEVQSAVSEC